MKKVIDETNRRRKVQQEYNIKHKIEPKTIYKTFEEIMSTTVVADSRQRYEKRKKTLKKDTSFSAVTEPIFKKISGEEKENLIKQLKEEMLNAAKDLEFERAAELRDEIERLSKL